VTGGDIAATADLAMLTDLAYGVLWYRLMIGHAPLDAEAADGLATHLIAAGQAGAESPGGDSPGRDGAPGQDQAGLGSR
jgi:hypothetical protein